MLHNGQEFECVIEKLGFGGEGITHVEEMVVFVKGGIPRQKVKAVLTKKKNNYGEARILEVLAKSPSEITAKCAHFGTCGGCKWQSLPYSEQLEHKEKQVKECLEHLGKIDLSKVACESIVPSPQEFAYRNKVEFSFGYETMTVDRSQEPWVYYDEDPTLGFHAPEKWEKVVNIDHCHLVSDSVNQVFSEVKAWCLDQDFDVYNPKTHQGFWRQLLIRENVAGEMLVNLVVRDKQEESFWWPLIRRIENAFPQVKSFFVTAHDGVSDDWFRGELIHLFGEKHIYETLFDMKFSISPQSFFQTNTRGAEALYSVVRDYAALEVPEDGSLTSSTILDLYCGTGTIGQILAGSNKYTQIVGLELLESAVKDAYLNAELNNLSNVEFVAGPAEKTLPEVLTRYDSFDVVVIDPPRSGMHPKALETLLTIQPKNIVYVSCNPSTLARDLRLLCDAGYTLEKVRPVDMFPHTAHIEVVTKLTRG